MPELLSRGYDRLRLIAPVPMDDMVSVRYTADNMDSVMCQSKKDCQVTIQIEEAVAVGTHIMRWVKNA